MRLSGAVVTQLKHFLESHQLPLDKHHQYDSSISHNENWVARKDAGHFFIHSIEFATAVRRHLIEVYV